MSQRATTEMEDLVPDHTDALYSPPQMTAEPGGAAAIHVFDAALRHLRVLLPPELVAADGLALDGDRHHPHPNPSPSPSPSPSPRPRPRPNHVLLPYP